ncbi:hypothetical protein OBBRIDRAFT_15593 [Obba rivulosa]|uniref:Secreted protein n=1 Tax=Obba rivulosa TaxID=1052685 RepID=A0A8E2DVM4_9APHY|nr:hypothetical protein OBBRIDRAFT_15593 [Obba rivulosa]
MMYMLATSACICICVNSMAGGTASTFRMPPMVNGRNRTFVRRIRMSTKCHYLAMAISVSTIPHKLCVDDVHKLQERLAQVFRKCLWLGPNAL